MKVGTYPVNNLNDTRATLPGCFNDGTKADSAFGCFLKSGKANVPYKVVA